MVMPGNRHTILVVDDDAAVLHLVQRILEGGNYEVICVSSAEEGIRIATEFPRSIHLLLADVVMPEMVGPDLAARLKVQRPDMRVMLMSGYPHGARLVLNYGWHFLRKPFVPKAFLEAIQAVLNSTAEQQGMHHLDVKAAGSPGE